MVRASAVCLLTRWQFRAPAIFKENPISRIARETIVPFDEWQAEVAASLNGFGEPMVIMILAELRSPVRAMNDDTARSE